MDKRSFNKSARRKVFAANLCAAMKEKAITQTALAEILDTTQQTVSRWCKGMCEPDYDTLILICGILEESPNELLNYTEETAKKYAIGYLIDVVSDTKEYRTYHKKLADKYLNKEITIEQERMLEKEKLNELYKLYCESHGLKGKEIDITKLLID